MENDVRETKAAVLQAVQTTIRRTVPGGSNADDVENLSKLCVMALVPTGEEDARDLCSKLSDQVITFVVARIRELETNPAMQNMVKLLLLEWCFRNDYLEEDWQWEWVSPSSGRAHFNGRVPLDQIPLPRP